MDASLRFPARGALVALALLAEASSPAAADIVSSNLTNSTDGTETATSSTWLAISFTTGTSASSLDSVTLLLPDGNTGAVVGIYSDVSPTLSTSSGGLSPDALLATLTQSGSYGAGGNTTFTGSLALAASTTYWVVLQATAGSSGVDWAWSADDAGYVGAGFTDAWAESDDAGATWFAYTSSPFQAQVVVLPAAVPEPGSIALVATGGALGLLFRRRARRMTR